MNRSRIAIVAAALAVGVLAPIYTSSAFADAEVNVSSGPTETGKPLAVRGYDVVAYFTDGKPTVGTEEFTTTHEGATYRFASAEHLKLFKESREKYLPQYGGFCAYGCFVHKKFDGDPLLWKIVDGKLYFNLNKSIQKKWSEETAEKIKTANNNWKEIEHKSIADVN
jgi:YHS domain-containing protein